MKSRPGDTAKRGLSDTTSRPRTQTPPPGSSPITLLTDFGTKDYFVGSLKGVILSVNPFASIVDITHEIPPQDIEAGAFTLLASYRSFPEKTIHVVVVDPGVGSTRRPLVVSAAGQYFVGPDNGIFSYVLDRESHHTHQLVHEKFFHHPVSPTFHGRDIFAPVAAALSTGIEPSAFGAEIFDAVRLPALRPVAKTKGKWKARIIHIDRFGNCVTNITRELLDERTESNARLIVAGKTIRSFRRFFADDNANENLFAIWGSAGFLEIAAKNRSAADLLKARRGQLVTLEMGRLKLPLV